MTKGDQDQDKNKIGKWTKLEVQKFTGGLYKHGRNWVKIQKMIKTRSIGQVRSYAQKYFAKMLPSDKVFLGEQIQKRSKLMLSYDKSKKLQTQVENKHLNLKIAQTKIKESQALDVFERQCPLTPQSSRKEGDDQLIQTNNGLGKIQFENKNSKSTIISPEQEYYNFQILPNNGFPENLNNSGYPLYYIFYPNYYVAP